MTLRCEQFSCSVRARSDRIFAELCASLAIWDTELATLDPTSPEVHPHQTMLAVFRGVVQFTNFTFSLAMQRTYKHTVTFRQT